VQVEGRVDREPFPRERLVAAARADLAIAIYNPRSTARPWQLAAARDLPMGRHDTQTMTSPEVGDAFQRFVKAKQELLALLQRMVEQDRRLLAEMGG